jgi:hypothetical protein
VDAGVCEWVWVSGVGGLGTRLRCAVSWWAWVRSASSVMSGNHREFSCKRVSCVGGEAQWQEEPACTHLCDFLDNVGDICSSVERPALATDRHHNVHSIGTISPGRCARECEKT